MHPIRKSRFQFLKDHYMSYGLQSRVHGNIRRTPLNTLTYQESENFKKFLLEYAENNSILLPGRIPGYKRAICSFCHRARRKRLILNNMYSKGKLSHYLYRVFGSNIRQHAIRSPSGLLPTPSFARCGNLCCHTSRS